MMTQSNYEYIWGDVEEQKAVVKIDVNGTDWLMDWDDWKLAEEEGRSKPVIYGDKLILVNDETYNELQKLTEWIKNNKN